jgi:hypothetical protein
MQSSCSRCRFWKQDSSELELGECRRYPPAHSTIEADEDVTPYFAIRHDWPLTEKDDYCGEFMSRALPSIYPAPVLAN